jgi:hypothetical protein
VLKTAFDGDNGKRQDARRGVEEARGRGADDKEKQATANDRNAEGGVPSSQLAATTRGMSEVEEPL